MIVGRPYTTLDESFLLACLFRFGQLMPYPTSDHAAQLIHQLAVKFQPLGVYRVRPRHYPRPADRKPIGLDPQLFQQGYILFIAVIKIYCIMT